MSTPPSPLNDPRFPNRPQHPDFWQLAQLCMKHDAETAEGKTLPEFAGEVVDEESLFYLAKQRCTFIARATGLDPKSAAALMTVYFDGFLLGHDYALVKRAQEEISAGEEGE